MITYGPGLVSRVSQLRPWWQISEWGLVQRFSFCRHSAADWEDERGSGERRESVLSLTLPHFGHFVLILKYFPKSAPFFFSYWENSSFFFSISRYFFNLLLGMSDTQFQQKTKTDLVILHEWLTHVRVPLSFFLSLSLMYVFSISRYLYLSISPLSFFISLCVSPSHSSVMVGRWGLLGELGVLRRSGRTLTLEMDHTSLSSAKPEAKFKQFRVYSSTW